MKVLVIGGYAPSLVNFRGPFLQSLIRKGHEVHAAAPGLSADAATATLLRDMGVTVHDIVLQRTGMNPLRDVASLWSLWRVMRSLSLDAVVVYTIKPVIWGTMGAAVAGVPRRFALITGLGYAFSGQMSGRRLLVNWIAKFLYRVALSKTGKVFFQNPDDAALFRTLGLLPKSIPAVVVNGSGVDLDYFAPVPLPSGHPSFLLIARLLKDKGIPEYARAAALVREVYPETNFHLVGPTDSGPDMVPLADLKQWQSEGVLVWHGEAADVRRQIARSHVYVLPSCYREGTPRTLLEAMSMGRPVITTDTPGCRETVIDGRNGILVPPRSAEALAAAMIKLIENPQLIEQMGHHSRLIAEDKYDVRKVNAVMLREMGLG